MGTVGDLDVAVTVAVVGAIDGHDAHAATEAHEPHVHLAADAETGDGGQTGERRDDQRQNPPEGRGAEQERHGGGGQERHAHGGGEARRPGVLEVSGWAQSWLEEGLVEAQDGPVTGPEGGAEEQHDGEHGHDPLLAGERSQDEGDGQHGLVGTWAPRIDRSGRSRGCHGPQPNPDLPDRQYRHWSGPRLRGPSAQTVPSATGSFDDCGTPPGASSVKA